MKAYIAILVLFTTSIVAATDLPRLEADYVDTWCEDIGGVQEYRLKDATRVDCLHEDFAVEFDFGHKWAECVGQAMFYAKETERLGICALIQKKVVSDISFARFVRRARVTASLGGVEIACINVQGTEILCPHKADVK